MGLRSHYFKILVVGALFLFNYNNHSNLKHSHQSSLLSFLSRKRDKLRGATKMHYHCLQCGKDLCFPGICSDCQAIQKKQHTSALTQAQVKAKIKYLSEHIAEIASQKKQANKDFWNFISFRGMCPPELQESALANAVYLPPELYYKASSAICESLVLSFMKTENIDEKEQLLYCIAMVGDKKAVEIFYKLQQNNFYLPPLEYAPYGGWTFDDTGKKQELIYPVCYPIVEDNTANNSIIANVKKDLCAYCGCQLVDILTIDGRQENLSFLDIHGIITATCCPECVCYETMFSQFTLDGKSTVLFEDGFAMLENTTDSEVLQQLQMHKFVLSKKNVPIFYAANGKLINTLGGFANWGENWYYTTCPHCGRTMKYLAQMQWNTLISFFQGTLYIEICPYCQIISMHCQ